jgi:Short C-terminal domain
MEGTRAARSRRALPIALIVVASLIGFFSVFALWAKRQALETDTWTETSTELLANNEIRSAVAAFLVTELYDNVDVEAAVAERLPPQLDRLAGPVAGALRQATGAVALRALDEPRVQALWEDANRTAHEKLLAVIDDDAEAVSTTGGVVTLDLSTILAQVADEVGIGADLVSKLPPDAGQLEVMQADELETVQTGVDLLRTLAWGLTALTLALYALAIYLARGRRRETLRAVGFSLVTVGVLLLFVHNLAGDAVVDSLADVTSAEPAVDATWTIGTSLLVATAEGIVAYGLFILFAAWLAGPTGLATSVREAITPYLRQPRYAYGGLALLLVLLFWWDPVVATHRLVPSLVLVVALAVGVEALRRQVIREFPDRVATSSAAGAAKRIAERMQTAREGRLAAEGTATADSPTEHRVAALERLAGLRDSGALSVEEFEQEKRRILGSAS